MKKPNFFIIGAPKCGTTALSSYLAEHPRVFFSNPKEPQFFAEDFAGHGFVHDLDAYLDLFAQADNSQPIVSEGSVFYLASQVAVENIREFNPAAKILVMLRNPLELLRSLHQHYLHALYEDQADLEAAWRLQEQRRESRQIPRLCRQPKLLQYRELCLLGEQLERVYRIFPKEQVKVVFFDDFVQDTAGVYREVLAFLGIDDDGRREFAKVNEARSLHPWMRRILSWVLPMSLRNNYTKLRFVPGLAFIPVLIEKLLKRPNKPRQLSEAFKAELKAVFAEDIAKLSRLTGRNLDHWLAI
jgi:hypothetical protein